jgi:hypothetical protein
MFSYSSSRSSFRENFPQILDKTFLILAGHSNLQDASAYTTILQKLEKISREEQEQGVFKSVIELLHLYAYKMALTDLFGKDLHCIF